MIRLRNVSIRRKLMVIMMLTAVLAVVLASAAYFTYDVVTFRAKLVRDLGALTETLRRPITDAVVYNDSETADSVLAGLDVQPQIVGAWVFDGAGELLAHFTRGNVATPAVPAADGHAFEDRHLVLYRRILFNDQVVGTIYIRSGLEALRDRLHNYLTILVAVIVGVSLVAFGISTALQRVVSNPVLDLVRVVKTVSEKQDYTVRAVKQDNDELGRLIDGFNEMLGVIRARDRELEEARRKAEQANQSKSVFLANMSHELRTPLTAIIGYSEILEDDAREMGLTDFQPDLQKIHAAGKHLLGLINTILDLSKVEAGKMEVFPERFEVGKLVDEVASTVRPLVEKNSNILEVQCPDGVGAAHADMTKMRQVLFNLLSNASKFTKQGRVRLDVSRDNDGGADWLVFRISDTGIGMNDEQLSRLFQPFSQAEASTARNYGGTGLGLAICKRFVQLMGGRIGVRSELGKGTSFTVKLPADIVAAKQPRSVHQMLESGEWNRSGAGSELPEDARLVLVVDDDLAVHELLADVLHREGFRVASARSGDEGLEMARKLRPAIITLDVYMPDKDGWAVLNLLKSDPELANIPVIMISVSDEEQKGYALGAEFLSKPIDRRRLVDLLNRYHTNDKKTPTGLVIDDDSNIRGMLRRVLEEQGWEVQEAEDGIAGLRRMAEQQPELILLDLMMPKMDGFDFVAQVRKNAAWRSVPVVVLTAMDIGPEERDRLNGGVERILQKGALGLTELKAEIRSLARATVQGLGSGRIGAPKTSSQPAAGSRQDQDES